MKPSTFFIIAFFYGILVFLVVTYDANGSSMDDVEYTFYSSESSSLEQTTGNRLGFGIWGKGNSNGSWSNYQQVDRSRYRTIYRTNYGNGW